MQGRARTHVIVLAHLSALPVDREGVGKWRSRLCYEMFRINYASQ